MTSAHNKLPTFLVWPALILAVSSYCARSLPEDRFLSAWDLQSALAAATPSCPAGKVIYTTSQSTTGAVGGIAAADAMCQSDAARPANGTYKALIVQSLVRVASASANAGDGQIDWVLKASQVYTQKDCSTTIMTTNANALFIFGALGSSFGTAGVDHWSGLAADWTTSANTCSGWLLTAVVSGQYGSGGATNVNAISAGGNPCTTSSRLICAEQ